MLDRQTAEQRYSWLRDNFLQFSSLCRRAGTSRFHQDFQELLCNRLQFREYSPPLFLGRMGFQ